MLYRERDIVADAPMQQQEQSYGTYMPAGYKGDFPRGGCHEDETMAVFPSYRVNCHSSLNYALGLLQSMNWRPERIDAPR